MKEEEHLHDALGTWKIIMIRKQTRQKLNSLFVAVTEEQGLINSESEYKYLVSNITIQRTAAQYTREIISGTNQAKRAFENEENKCSYLGNIDLKARKTRYWRACVWSVAPYESETRTILLGKMEEKTLLVFETRCYGRTLGISWTEHIL